MYKLIEIHTLHPYLYMFMCCVYLALIFMHLDMIHIVCNVYM
jgi:hypothetical protein